MNADLDFGKASFSLFTVNCSDDGLPVLTTTKTVVIHLQDVNEAPTAVLLSGSHTVAEDATEGDIIGKLTPVDDDKGQVYTYAIYGRGVSAFKVNGGET